MAEGNRWSGIKNPEAKENQLVHKLVFLCQVATPSAQPPSTGGCGRNTYVDDPSASPPSQWGHTNTSHRQTQRAWGKISGVAAWLLLPPGARPPSCCSMSASVAGVGRQPRWVVGTGASNGGRLAWNRLLGPPDDEREHQAPLRLNAQRLIDRFARPDRQRQSGR